MTEEMKRGQTTEYFETFLLDQGYPYEPNEKAINNTECLELAKKIISKWDNYSLEHVNPSHDEMKKHLKDYEGLLLSELREHSALVTEVRKAIRNLDQHTNLETKMYDHLIRIREVFRL